MQWELITNIILISSFAILALFALLALFQWITRKSIKKVDRQLLCIPIPLIILTAAYFIFDKLIIISTRPNGSGESSFPSTHVMVVSTIFFIVMLILPKYVKSKTLRVILNILMVILIALTCTGRVLANMHYPLDVIGGIVFAFLFSEIYYIIIKRKKK